MEQSVRAIGQNKWQKLSALQQHRALARYCAECIDAGHDYDSFIELYQRVMDWVSIDRYVPPQWLNKREMLEGYFTFHQSLSKKPPGYYRKEEKPGRIPWKPSLPVTVILDQVITPYNFGSILRVMDNCGFADIVYHNPHLDMEHPNILRSSRGAIRWIPVRHEDDLYRYIEHSSRPVVGLEKTPDALPIQEWNPPKGPFSLLLGNEVYGISRSLLKLCDPVISIPVSGYKNSMNVSHSLAVTGYFIRQFHGTD